jgi:hypothetical protein
MQTEAQRQTVKKDHSIGEAMTMQSGASSPDAGETAACICRQAQEADPEHVPTLPLLTVHNIYEYSKRISRHLILLLLILKITI